MIHVELVARGRTILRNIVGSVTVISGLHLLDRRNLTLEIYRIRLLARAKTLGQLKDSRHIVRIGLRSRSTRRSRRLTTGRAAIRLAVDRDDRRTGIHLRRRVVERNDTRYNHGVTLLQLIGRGEFLCVVIFATIHRQRILRSHLINEEVGHIAIVDIKILCGVHEALHIHSIRGLLAIVEDLEHAGNIIRRSHRSLTLRGAQIHTLIRICIVKIVRSRNALTTRKCHGRHGQNSNRINDLFHLRCSILFIFYFIVDTIAGVIPLPAHHRSCV